MGGTLTEDRFQSRVAHCVSEALREVNTLRAADEQLIDDPSTVLVGSGGPLDSLGLVNLAVALEGAVERDFGRAIGVAADVLSAEDPSAYRTVGLLIQFVSDRVAAQKV